MERLLIEILGLLQRITFLLMLPLAAKIANYIFNFF